MDKFDNISEGCRLFGRAWGLWFENLEKYTGENYSSVGRDSAGDRFEATSELNKTQREWWPTETGGTRQGRTTNKQELYWVSHYTPLPAPINSTILYKGTDGPCSFNKKVRHCIYRILYLFHES